MQPSLLEASFNIVIKACPRWSDGLKIFQDLKTSALRPSIVSYNSALRSCVPRTLGKRNVDSYGLWGLCGLYFGPKTGLFWKDFAKETWTAALQILKSMQLRPDLVSCNTALRLTTWQAAIAVLDRLCCLGYVTGL